jgi:3-deoxy-D-manno-octulosonate 8-phosphate phosphatase KdsC-like HAD superfamily phosphatase
MKPLGLLDARAVRFVLLDIDDTLTTRGKLGAQAYGALEALQRAGKKVILVTGARRDGAITSRGCGRSMPWSAKTAHSISGSPRQAGKAFHRRRVHARQAAARAAKAGKSILRQVPGAALASDQPYRETDPRNRLLRGVPPLSPKPWNASSCHNGAGLNAKVSSIHVNGWFGRYDKLATARRLFTERFGVDLGAENRHVVYAGDSPNDAPMFGFFDNSVGVANVRRFPDLQPKYVTEAEAGAGFAELAAHLLRTS